MKFGLIPYRADMAAHGKNIYLAEFHPGPEAAARWSDASLYMDGDVFEALVFIVDAFTLKRPVTLEGNELGRLVEDLEDAARRISHADSPKAIWPYSAGFGYTQFNSVRDWPSERQAFTTMLRDLGAWVRAVGADGKPVTIRGM
jgi:hypothetical protein